MIQPSVDNMVTADDNFQMQLVMRGAFEKEKDSHDSIVLHCRIDEQDSASHLMLRKSN